MRNILLIGIAGGLGALTRYGLSTLVGILAGGLFPWGIFLVNVTGCFLFGLVWSLGTQYSVLSDATRLVLLTGFMGSFTTFSTLIFDSHLFFEAGKVLLFCLNLLGQILLGLAALHLGIKLMDLLIHTA